MTEETSEDSETDSDNNDAYVPTSDKMLVARIRRDLRAFSLRQSEILRVAGYLKDRSDEIDGVTERAKTLIMQQLQAVDDDVVAGTVDFLRKLADSDAVKSGDLSNDEVQLGVKKALDDLVSTMPPGAQATYLEAANRAMYAPPGVGMLHASLLVMMVGELEAVVQALARTVIEHTPTALEDSGRTYSWSEIAEYGSMDDFRDHVVDQTIETVLRGSLDDWMRFFETRFKIQPPAQAKAYSALEAVQRRHLIVHNGAAVSNLYLDKLKGFPIEEKLGDQLEVDYDYLVRAADSLYVVGFGLSVAAAFKLCTDPEMVETVESMIGDRLFFFLQERRYELVLEIGKSVKVDKLTSEYARLVIQVNTWLAQKRLGRFDDCRSVVERFDVSTRSGEFKLAKLALLDAVEEAHALAQQMLESGELSMQFWVTWPLLHEVREFDRNKKTRPVVDMNDENQ